MDQTFAKFFVKSFGSVKKIDRFMWCSEYISTSSFLRFYRPVQFNDDAIFIVKKHPLQSLLIYILILHIWFLRFQFLSFKIKHEVQQAQAL